jgi:hypothetical protein
MFMPSAPQMSSKTNTDMVTLKYGALEDARMPSIGKADIAQERGIAESFRVDVPVPSRKMKFGRYLACCIY